MSSDISKLFTKHRQTCVMIKNLVDETMEALNDIGPNIKITEEIDGIIRESNIQTIKKSSEREPIIVIDGQDNHAKAMLVNHILGEDILPTFSSHWRAVYLKYGPTKILRTMWNIDFEVVNGTRPYQSFSVLHTGDLYRWIDGCTIDDPWFYAMEAELPNPILNDNIKILVIPDCTNYKPNYLFWRGLEYHLKDHTPVILYAIHGDEVKPNSLPYIEKLKRALRVPFLFVCIADCNEASSTDSLTESLQHSVETKNDLIYKKIKAQLFYLGHLTDTEIIKKDEIIQREHNNITTPYNMVTSFENFHKEFVPFIEEMLKLNTLNLARKLSEIHNKCVRRFILSAFDMAREIQITPKRLYYARAEEQRLYLELKVYADDQQNCLTGIINDVVQEMKMNMEEFLTEFDEIYNASDNPDRTTYEAKIKIQDLILQRLRNGVAQRLSTSIACLQECVTGTLERCLKNIETACDGLEANASASNALKQILTAAYNIDIRATTSFSVIHIFMNRCKKLFTDYISPVYGNIWPLSDRDGAPSLEFKLRTLSNMMRQLSRGKLAKSISSQFREQIKSSHEAFLLAVRLLDSQLSGRLEQTEEQRVLIRKKHAPKFARLALESTSLCDFITYGMPEKITDIGRGQYGVVYSCEPWGGIELCALKSVVPLDDRHWNDLAMEFYYTRTIPEHPRILKLRGSVIDYNYANGNSPAVLLMMERMFRDLHCGIRQGLGWLIRLQIAIDVVAGLRYLHSQGLVHRDIKLKNVLLDKSNRAKLTDFGFCIPEAMMSGSIVGTPVHMAPELLLGRYDSSVDVYAFGILFWYICSGQVKLPNRFDQFQNKEQLWNHVRRGIRPECLPQFTKPCWSIMEQCWAGEPSDRPLLGDVELQLQAIYQSALENPDANN